jgi:hypothetical protein
MSVTAAMRVDSENPGHTIVSVLVGRNAGARGHAGTLTFRSDEMRDLGTCDAEGRLVIPFEMIDNRSDAITMPAPNTYNDPLEVLLELVTSTCEVDDVTIGYGGNDPLVPTWYAYAYWYSPSNQPPEDGRWEIEATGPTLRAVLAQVIGHPRFGQWATATGGRPRVRGPRVDAL